MNAQKQVNANGSGDGSARWVLRTYQPTDRDVVDFVFYTTYLALVPEAVKRKLMSPLSWAIWIALYASGLALVPVIRDSLALPHWTTWALNTTVTVGWALVWFACLFFISERIEVMERIEKARQNDLNDPEVFYLDYIKYDRVVSSDSEQDQNSAFTTTTTTRKKRVTFDKHAKKAVERIRELKPEAERTPSHFWVLTVDGKVCGMVGLACNSKTVYDRQSPLPPLWKRLGGWACERFGRRVPAVFMDNKPTHPQVFLNAHAPTTATLLRLAVRFEYQGYGLSTPLLTGMMHWARQHGIKHIEALTDELQTTAAGILRDKYGFKRVKSMRTGWFGQHTLLWRGDVDAWSANVNITQSYNEHDTVSKKRQRQSHSKPTGSFLL